MTSIGDRLRQERLRRGLDIYQLADQTKINPSMLEAIEADDLEKLPGSFFTRSFVRQYVRALGLDEDEFEPELKRITDAEERPVLEPEPERAEIPLPAAPPAPAPRSSGDRHPFGALLAFVAIVALCSLIYTLWQRTRNAAVAEPDRATFKVVRPPAAAATAPQAQSPASETTKPQTEPAVSAEQTAAPPAAQPEQAAAPAGEAGPIRVQVQATGTVWVRMIADGKTLYEGTLAPNESRTFDGQEAMNLRVGDAAAVTVTWNTKPIGEIGPAGQPRTVKFTTGEFRVLNPAPPKPLVQNDGL